MPKPYRIQVDLDMRKVDASTQKSNANLAKFEQQVAKGAAAAERAAEKQAKAAERAADRKARADKAASDKAVRQADTEAARLERAADVMLARRERRYQAFQEQQARASERRIKRELSDEDVALAVRNKAVDNANKKRVRAALDSAGVERKTWSEAIRDATTFNASMTKLGVTMMALDVGRQAVQAIAGALADAARNAADMAKEVFSTVQDLREVAAIKEKSAPDLAELAQHIKLRRETGLTQEMAKTYQQNLGNALGTVSKDILPPKERAALEIEGGKFVARTSTTAQTAAARGAMLGILPNFMKGKTTAKDVMAMGDAVDVILGKGAGEQGPMTEQFREVLTTLTDENLVGFLRDPRQAAALTAVASGFDKTAPAHATLMAIRQGRKFANFRKMKGMTASASETLAQAKITETDDPIETLTKLFSFADENMGKGEAFDAFLLRRGFREAESNRRLAQWYSQYKKGVFGEIVGLAGGKLDTGAPERKAEEFRRDPLSGAPLFAKAAEDAARLEVGTEYAGVTLAKMKAGTAAVRGDVSPLTTLQRYGRRLGSLWTMEGRDVELESTAAREAAARPGAPALLSAAVKFGELNPTGITSGFLSLIGIQRALIASTDANTAAIAAETARLRAEGAFGGPAPPDVEPAPLRPGPRTDPRVH